MATPKNVYELAQERLELILESSIQYACLFRREGQRCITEPVYRLYPA